MEKVAEAVGGQEQQSKFLTSRLAAVAGAILFSRKSYAGALRTQSQKRGWFRACHVSVLSGLVVVAIICKFEARSGVCLSTFRNSIKL